MCASTSICFVAFILISARFFEACLSLVIMVFLSFVSSLGGGWGVS